ncbi:MAG: transposase [Proteobacteria bacterium]|nr:transposase [Pseudomonadota bacterium]
MYHDLPVWAFFVIVLALTHITIAAVTIYLHRCQAHRALELHPAVSHFFRFWLWLTTGQGTREWVAVHRKHHARVETNEDPHSPQVVGIKKVLFEGVELYREECKNQQTLEKYGHETPDDWLERNIYRRFSFTGTILMLIIDVCLFGFIGITIWAVQMAWVPFFAAGVINGMGHWGGYRNFESPDASTNIIPFGLVVAGEELHNNHHAFASSARFSNKWYEFDLGWNYIKLLEGLGLARVKKVAPKPVINRSKLGIDMDTVRAIVKNHFHVMSHYARDVVKTVYKDEKTQATTAKRKLLKSSKRLLTKHEFLLDSNARRRLEELFAQSDTLQVVYEFRQRLQALWLEKTASQESLLAALQEWCNQAEATGIKALEEFSQSLRGYTLQPT